MSGKPPTEDKKSPGRMDDASAKKYWRKRYQQEHNTRIQLEERLKAANDMLASRNTDFLYREITDEQIKEAVLPLYHSRHQAAMSAENDIEIARAVMRAIGIGGA